MRRPRMRRRRGAVAAAPAGDRDCVTHLNDDLLRAAAVAGGPDCFTHLNDDLLRTIVSRLPIRSAALLGGASRHFRAQVRGVLDRVDSLTLHEPHLPTPLRDSPPLLLRRLAIAPHPAIPPSSFRPILENAAAHGISELVIRLTRRARLPKNVLSVRSLAVLTLETCAVPRWSIPACPCLRTLRLRRVAIHQDTINEVLASASSLETLEMVYCTGHGRGGSCMVESSSIRNLVFRPPVKQKETAIRAWGLRTITLYTRAKARSLELAPAPEVRKAYLHICKTKRRMESFRVRSFLDAGTRLQCLTLRGQAIKRLASEYEGVPKLAVMFPNLRILSLSLYFSSEQQLVFLLKLLECCPNLQQLTLSAAEIDEDKADEADEDKADDADEGKAADADEGIAAETNEGMAAEANEDKALPCFTDHQERLATISCLTNSLVQFRFFGFEPEEYQKGLIVFLLTQARNLKMVGVQFEKNQETAVKEILSVRRAPIQRTSRKYTGLYMELDYSG